MTITFISTYPPQECGIATFTQNLVESVSGVHEKIVSEVIVVEDDNATHEYPAEVSLTIKKNSRQDYLEAAKFINQSSTDICILQHEFGIFGGESGMFILLLAHELEVPLMVTLHTVLKKPSFMERSIVQSLGRKADRLLVMSNLGASFLEGIYEISSDKIAMVEHGVPDFTTQSAVELTEKIDFSNNKTILTFGLLGRNKGIETVLMALPQVIRKHPDVLYIILGKTHPNVLKETGENYRSYLKSIIEKNNLGQHVVFINKFVSEEELFKYLSSVDIYVTPYLNEAQITSGTLSYALGAGAAVISTPYWHAKELLSNGLGRLFNFKDSESLAENLIDLLDHPEKLEELKNKAFAYGDQVRWKTIGRRYFNLALTLVENFDSRVSELDGHYGRLRLPRISFDHLRRLTDDTGIIQHAKYGIPNFKEGYCLDDNARALLAAIMAYENFGFEEALKLVPIYFSYIHYMQNVKGTFRNFLSFSRQFLDEEGSEDAFGRTIWALGYLIKHAPNDAYYQLAKEIFFRAAENFEKLRSNRGIANTIIGISYYLQRSPADEKVCHIMERMTYVLIDRFDSHKTSEWQWFEDILSYDNGILPLALYHSFEITMDEKVRQVAEASTVFLDRVTLFNGYLNPIGSDGWYLKGGKPAQFAQQATDVMAMVLLNYRAYLITGKTIYLEKMCACYEWFLGKNDLRIPLYDPETKGCCDGLEYDKVNRNQGAESTLAYLISRMAIEQVTALKPIPAPGIRIPQRLKADKENHLITK